MWRASTGAQRGLSIIELVVTIGVSIVLVGIGISSFVTFSKREALEAGAAAIAGGLRDARAQTLASVGGTQYGVKLEPSNFVLYRGAVYDSSAPDNELFYFSSYLRASSTPSLFLFQRITGNAMASGTIDIYLASDPSVKRTITVGSTGLVKIQ